MRRWGGNIFVDFSLFIYLSNTKFMKKFKFDVKKYNIDPQNNCNLQNHHTFHPEEKMVNLESALVVYLLITVQYVMEITQRAHN